MCMNSKKFEKKFKIKMPSIIDQINFEAKITKCNNKFIYKEKLL